MNARYAIADVAALVGEPSRAAILLALLDGRALPAGELARQAGISAAATSLHLSKLTQAALLVVHREGRHRYYRLASADVAHALESLGVLATRRPLERAISPERAELGLARSCYDHLAGKVAVEIAAMLEREGLLRATNERAYEVTARGAAWFADAMEIDAAALAGARRALARRCLDWTERRPHVAGALGAAMLERLFEMRWAARVRGSRVVRITARGDEGFARLGVPLAPVAMRSA
jgi:DNA-binding transcriptional ArsR family regulator